MELEGGGTLDDLHKEIEEKAAEYPDGDMFGTLPAYGFYIRHATNITFDGIQITTKNADLRPALYLDDVKWGNFSNLYIQSSEENVANICGVLFT